MAFKGFEQLKEEADKRGYYMSEMTKIQQKLEQEICEWKRRFDSYIDIILHDDPSQPTNTIIQKSADLCDARQEFLRAKFKDYEETFEDD